MLLVCLLSFAVASGVGVRFELLPYDPVANETAQVVLNSVRITVLTDRLFRITIGPPEDRATLAFINRKLPVPSFVNSSIGGTLSVETKLVRVQITGSDLGSLSVTSKANAFAPWTGLEEKKRRKKKGKKSHCGRLFSFQ